MTTNSDQYNNNAQQYTHSIKIETTAKGLAQVSVHVYSNSKEEVQQHAVTLYLSTISDLRDKGVKIAE